MCVFNYEFRYRIHYLIDGNITILLLDEELSNKDAFSFLNDVNEDIKKIDDNEILIANANQFPKGAEILRKQLNYYNGHPITTLSGKIIDELNLAKNIVIENIEKVIKRDNVMEIIANKSDNLKEYSINLNNYADSVRRYEISKNNRFRFFIGVIVVIVIFLLIFII